MSTKIEQLRAAIDLLEEIGESPDDDRTMIFLSQTGPSVLLSDMEPAMRRLYRDDVNAGGYSTTTSVGGADDATYCEIRVSVRHMGHVVTLQESVLARVPKRRVREIAPERRTRGERMLVMALDHNDVDADDGAAAKIAAINGGGA